MAGSAHLFQLGMDSGAERRHASLEDQGRGGASAARMAATGQGVISGPWCERAPGHGAAPCPSGHKPAEAPDHFVTRDGRTFAGTHLIIDLWGASRLDELDHVRVALVDAAGAAGATLLHIHLHHFTPNGGVSGVAVLAESHISIHTWPERGYAALDLFMCGDAEPARAIPVLERAFRPERTEVGTVLRGEIATAA